MAGSPPIEPRGSAISTSAPSDDDHHPYVPDDAQLHEFTFGAVLAGISWALSSAPRRSISC